MHALWAMLVGSLAVYSVLTFLIMVWAVFFSTIERRVLIINSILIGSTGAIAWALWQSYLR